jgi:hypothetical protein
LHNNRTLSQITTPTTTNHNNRTLSQITDTPTKRTVTTTPLHSPHNATRSRFPPHVATQWDYVEEIPYILPPSPPTRRSKKFEDEIQTVRF